MTTGVVAMGCWVKEMGCECVFVWGWGYGGSGEPWGGRAETWCCCVPSCLPRVQEQCWGHSQARNSVSTAPLAPCEVAAKGSPRATKPGPSWGKEKTLKKNGDAGTPKSHSTPITAALHT